MNEIFSLKYSIVTDGLIAVSELTKRVTSGVRKKLILASVIFFSCRDVVFYKCDGISFVD